MKNIAIIGAGMSGMVAAIVAARKKHKVTLYERNDRVGKKILLTGNGKCNLSAKTISENNYVSKDKELLPALLNNFSKKQEEDFWRSLGLLTKEKNGGIYPVSNQASSVLDVLRYAVKRLNVEVICDSHIREIIPAKDGFQIDGRKFQHVILACGGKAGVYNEEKYNGFSLAKSLGHEVVPCYPALVQTVCKGDFFKAIAGVRADVRIALCTKTKQIATEQGELQITDYGLSGIPVFQHSRLIGPLLAAKEKVAFEIDLLPAYSIQELQEHINARKAETKEDTLEEFLTGMVNKKLLLYFLKKNGMKPVDLLNNTGNKKMQEFLTDMKHWHVEVKELKGFKNAQVSTGGVRLSEVTPLFTSKKCSRLSIVGEMLDVTGACGGYNLHFATLSGYIAADSIE